MDEKRIASPNRPTEGVNKGLIGSVKIKSVQEGNHRGRGRPKGSANKPKPMFPPELAKELLASVGPLLPDAEYKEIHQAITEGKAISTLNQAKIMLAIMSVPLYKRLLDEAKPQQPAIPTDIEKELGIEPDNKQVFARDTNDRIKVWKDILEMIMREENKNDDSANSATKPIFEIFARRGAGSDRLRVLIGVESSSVDGDIVRIGGEADSARALPDQLPQRQIIISDSEQEQTGRPLDGDFRGSGPRGDDEA